jgi:hypothetical protein
MIAATWAAQQEHDPEKCAAVFADHAVVRAMMPVAV